MKYIVETEMIFGWENCWFEDDERPTTFNSIREAQAAIDELVDDIKDSVELGHMQEGVGTYRIVEK